MVSYGWSDHKSTDPERFDCWANILPMRTKFHTTPSVLISYLGTTFRQERKHLAKTRIWHPKPSNLQLWEKLFSCSFQKSGKKLFYHPGLKELCSFSEKHKMSFWQYCKWQRSAKLSLWVHISMCVFFSSSDFVPWGTWMEVEARWNGSDMPWA